ncbi:MAG: hypothetical protein QG652_1365 [Pseudomonadota bacterium]|nr:hypothetical protein [Pseudomonadota bacterium]
MLLRRIFIVALLISGSGLLRAADLSSVPATAEKTVLEKISLPPLAQMPDLSLRLLQQFQPALRSDNVENWLQWEKKRLQFMNQLGLWRDVLLRCNEHEEWLKEIGMPSNDRDWLKTQRIQAWLELHEYDQAMHALQQTLWQAGAESEMIAIWRQQLIHVYLGLDNIADAERAMRRYREDYAGKQSETVNWKILQAQLLMRVNRPQEAFELIQHITQPRAQALALLAQMQAQLLSPAIVNEMVQKNLDRPDLKDEQRILFLYVSYRVAIAGLDLAAQTSILEQLIVNPARQSLGEVFAEARKEITTDQLWRSYEQYGLQVANEQQLLQGDDDAWLVLAEKLADVPAKSLNATLALHAQQPELQQQAILRLSALLEKQAEGTEIMRALFLRSSLASMELLPLILRYRLMDHALSRGDLQTAARLMETLQQPPQGQDIFDWHLRRARVLILSGQYEAGAAILQEQAQQPALTEPQIDQYLQVAFDLQAVQQHQLALAAFFAIEQQTLPEKNRRELAYWKAESLQNLARYEQAAMLYLESAPAPDGSFDPWYHTASFQAAEALAQAGLIIDARRQYLALLNITADPARQAVIRQRLQDLRLLKRPPQPERESP